MDQETEKRDFTAKVIVSNPTQLSRKAIAI
jgi:hypothetical protein